MKILKFFALVCAITLAVCSCASPQITPSPGTAPPVDSTKYHSIYSQHIQFQQLSDAEKNCYGTIYTSVRDNLSVETMVQDDSGKTVPGLRIPLAASPLTMTQITRLFEAFYLDNPDFFFVDRTYSLEGREVNHTQVYDTLVLRYTMNAAQRTTATNALNDALQDILKDCPTGNDDYLAELYLHDTLLSHCTYDQKAAESSSRYPNAYSAYGALVEGSAVCEGYAKAMQLLLTAVSIPATVVRGYSAENQTAHMWNLVQINGYNYYLDPTWDDDEKRPHYAYFNITSNALQRTHIIDADSLFTVNCTADADNYYTRNKTRITVYDRDAIADAIAAHVQQGATTVHLGFDEGKFENGLLFLKNANLTKKMVDARLTDGRKMWNYELHTNGKQNTISLHMVENNPVA